MRYQLLISILVVALALVLRLPLLNSSFWLDEAAQALQSQRPLSQQLQIKDDFQPPLLHLLVHGLLQFSRAEWWLRTSGALLPGLITIWATMMIGAHIEQLLSQQKPTKSTTRTPSWTGSIAGLLLATSSFHIFYSQELRPYSLPAMWCALGWLLILQLQRATLLHKKTDKAIGVSAQVNRRLLAWGIVNAFGLYSSYLYPFALVGQGLYLLWITKSHRAVQKKVLIACGGILAAFLPWLPFFFEQLRAGQALRAQLPGWEAVVSLSQLRAPALTFGKFLFGVLDLSPTPFFIGSAGLFILTTAILLWSFYNKQAESLQKILPLCICWGVIPFLVAWVISFVVPVIQPKRVLFLLPFFYLGIAILIRENAKEKSSQLLRFLSAAVLFGLLGLNLFSTQEYYRHPHYQREDWRGLSEQIMRVYGEESSHLAVVAFSFPAPFASWEWYETAAHPPSFATGTLLLSADPAAADRQRLKTLTLYEKVLVFTYLLDLTDPHRQMENDLMRYGYTETAVLTSPTPIGQVRVYSRSPRMIGSTNYERKH